MNTHSRKALLVPAPCLLSPGIARKESAPVKHSGINRNTLLLILVLSLSGMFRVYAQSFEAGGFTGKLESTVTTGTGIRTSDADKRDIGSSFGSNGKPKGGSGADVVDDGELNFRKGDLYSSPTQFFTRLNLKRKSVGITLSARGWTDFTMTDHRVPQGNMPNFNQPNSFLSDSGFGGMNRFSSVIPWEMYATVTPKEGTSLRVGRQVVNWSTAKFFLDSSHINTVDTNVINMPGGLVDRELDIPTGMLDFSFKTPVGVQVEGFYKLENRVFNIPGCGTMFSPMNLGVDRTCQGVTANAYTNVNALDLPAAAALWDNSGYMALNQYTIPRSPNVYRDQYSQGGLALRYKIKKYDLDLSVYALNLETGLPSITTHTNSGVNQFGDADIQRLYTDVRNTAPGIFPMAGRGADLATYMAGTVTALKNLGYNFDYVGNLHTFGINAQTNLRGFAKGWHMATEFEYSPNASYDYNAPDKLFALLGANDPIANQIHTPTGTPTVAPGTWWKGWNQMHQVKADVNFLRIFPKVLHSQYGVVFVEAADQGITNLPSLQQARFGRAYTFGVSTQNWGAANGASSDAVLCAVNTNNIPSINPNGFTHLAGNPEGCVNKGYVTANAFGYRVRALLNYQLKHNITLSPSVIWMHDVKGNSGDQQLIDKRATIKPSLDWTYGKHNFGSFAYSGHALASVYNTMQDRNYVTISTGMNF